MTQYILRRLLQSIPLVFFVSLILFILMNSAGDPLATMGGRIPPRAEDRQRLRRQLGLDQPILTQYLYWLVGNDWVMLDLDGDGEGETEGTRKGVIRGDFGTSVVTRQPAMEVISSRIENTMILMLTAEGLAIIIALAIGIYSAMRQYSAIDNLLTSFSFITFSVPIFLLGLILIYVFAVQFKAWGLPHFPTSGMYDPLVGKTFQQVSIHMVLPVTTIALISIAGYSRFIRSTMLEVINSDYIRTARSKGISERRILYLHAFKNASLPLVTLIGLNLPGLIAGAVVTETIFAWPGMGRLFIDHLLRSDVAVIMGLLMIITVAVILSQLMTDIVYTWLDPRIRYS
ncbi:MAG: ABC transporter permease [Aggregatilineales bacterium]